MCFGRLTAKSGTKSDLTCEQRLRELDTNGQVLSARRRWWTRLQIREPKHTQNFLDASGLTKDEVDQKLKVGRQTESSQRWARILASRASSSSSSLNPESFETMLLFESSESSET